MSWDATGYGAHAETAVEAPSTTWYLAEGSTAGDFSLFYLLQNPNASAMTATVRFLRPSPQAPMVLTYTLPPQLAHDDSGRRGGAGAREHGRLRRHHRDAADHRRAVDVSEPARRAVRGRPRERGRHRDRRTRGSSPKARPAAFFELFVLIANPNPTTSDGDRRLPAAGRHDADRRTTPSAPTAASRSGSTRSSSRQVGRRRSRASRCRCACARPTTCRSSSSGRCGGRSRRGTRRTTRRARR